MWIHKSLVIQLQSSLLFGFLLSTQGKQLYVPQECTGNIASSENDTILYFLTFLPYPNLDESGSESQQPSWDGGPDILPAAQLAVEHINQNMSILKGYKIVLINEDCGCNLVSRAIVNFVDELVQYNKSRENQTRIAGIVGPGCSDSTLVISSLTGRSQLSLLNVHIASSPFLQNRAVYPNAFGVLGSSYSLVDTVFSLMKLNNWTEVAALYDESRVSFYNNYRNFEGRISTEVPSAKIVYHSAIYDTNIPISDIMKKSARVIIVFTRSSFARKIMCMAYHEVALFPTHQWVLTGRSLDEFISEDIDFVYNDRRFTCLKEEMQRYALEGNLFVNYKLVPVNTTEVTEAGISYEEYLTQYQEKVQCFKEYGLYSNISSNIWATLIYDAVWSLALALNATINETQRYDTFENQSTCSTKDCHTQDLFEHQLGNEGAVESVRGKLEALKFEGVSGYIKFDNSTGFASRKINIYQVHSSQEINIGFSNEGDLTLFDIPNVKFIKLTTTYDKVLAPVFAFFISITLLQTIAILVLHMLSLLYWKHPSIKASSPKLNQLVYLGCYLLIIVALNYTLYKGLAFEDFNVVASVCHAQWAWLLPISITLIIGTLTARTWRIYRIFVHYTHPGPFLSNKALWCLIVFQVGIDVVFGALWTILDHYRLESLPNDQYVKDGVVITVRKCVINHYEYWLPILAVYKSLQIFLLVLLSILTRHIKSKHFTTLSLRIGSYLTSALYVIFLPTYFLLWYIDVEQHIDFSLFCIMLNASIFVCLVCVLLPPLLPLLRKK